MSTTNRPTELRVHVRAYDRVRFGRNEHVCKHTRSWPGQMDLFI